MKHRGTLSVLLFSLFLWSCGGDSTPTTPTPVATSITLSVTSLSFNSLGATSQISATVKDQNDLTMASATVTWATSDAAVATVSVGGLVTSVADGTATITAMSGSASATATTTVSSGNRLWIDTHAHPVGLPGTCFTESCLDATIEIMEAYGVERALLMNPPSLKVRFDQEDAIAEAVALRPDRFYYVGGGASLNGMIHQGTVSEATFANMAQELIEAGAVGFGETASLHLSYSDKHAFEEISPNSEWFRVLADLAVTHDVVIDMHMDVVVETKTTPGFFTARSNNNPSEIQGNIDDFKLLLDYNTEARIVWAHVGRDTTGDMRAQLVGNMLAAHDNLYIQVHPLNVPLHSQNAIVDEEGTIRTEWLQVLEDYPTRVVMGSDVFFVGGETKTRPLAATQSFLQQLSEELAYQIGCENPVAIYKLSAGCSR